VSAVNEIVYETIAEVIDPSVAQVLVAALRGYGFHPLTREGVGGFPGVTGFKGMPIEVPEAEATDARVLANSLLRDMTK
jgi:hypothetical protein